MIGRPPWATLLASLVAHGAAVAVLFFLASGQSHPSVLLIDLETVADRAAPVAPPESRAPRGGRNTKRASIGSASPAGRAGGRPGPTSPSVATTAALPPPLKPATPPEPEPVREPVREPAPEPVRTEEPTPTPVAAPRQPEPAVAVVPAREPALDVAPRGETSAAVVEPPTSSGGTTGDRMAATPDSGGGGRATAVPSTAAGGAGGRAAVASGGPAGGTPGAEYGGYLASVRRRIIEALRYPSTARSRGLTGTVYLEIFIKSDGEIGDVLVKSSSSHPLLDEAALEAVRNLAPQPFPKGLAPRPLRVRLPVVFDLQ